MNKIAIITPVYNDTQNLLNALQSLKYQNCDNFEVVVIDDGENNNIVSLLSTFKFNIHYIKNNHNMGVGASRNVGLDYVYDNNFDYLMFLDSDDVFKSDAIKIAYDSITQYDVEWLQFYAELPGSDIISCNIPSDTLWNGIYSVNTLKKYNIRFPEILSHEDLYFISLLRILGVSHKLIPDVLYKHNLNINSITHTNKLLEYNYIKIINELCNYINNFQGIFQLHNPERLSELILYCYTCHQICKLQHVEDNYLITSVKNILNFASEYSIMNYSDWNISSQILVGKNNSVYEEPCSLYIFRQSLDQWLKKYGYNYSLRVLR